jgi:hypothetical protein
LKAPDRLSSNPVAMNLVHVRSSPEFCVTGFVVSDRQSPFEVYGKLV